MEVYGSVALCFLSEATAHKDFKDVVAAAAMADRAAVVQPTVPCEVPSCHVIILTDLAATRVQVVVQVG